jgi:methylase of polypeptide subunit release factors
MASRIQLQQSLQKPYDRLLFAKDVLSQIFNSNLKLLQSLAPTSNQLTVSERKVISAISIYGTITLEDGAEVTCYEITLQPKVRIEQSKVAIQHYARKLLTSGQAALVNFISPDNKKVWRLTLVAMDSELTPDGVKEKSTNAKRFTFLLGPGESCKTAAERFEALSIEKAIDLKALVKAFSVERLSKAFFDEYKLHYEKFRQYLSQSNFKKSVFNADEKLIRDFVKKLLGRLVFLSFVQKKGWLGATSTDYKDGDPNFLMNLYLSSGANEVFYERWLKALFFDTLNNHKGRPGDDYILPNKSRVKIPFLNGGLFDKEDIDQKMLTFEPKLFHNPDSNEDPKQRGFLDFLQAFNFTVHEDSPDDHTIAVDPEMLGHIFENLLEDNKDRGTFYTPKEIVHYMCQESLIEYVVTESGLERETVERLVRYKDVEKVDASVLRKIDSLLDKVKICDPAIGSGAFPMGLLLEIFSIKEVIAYESNADWNPANVKENVIQRSIYGVDIEKGAVDIARLRFWLSLVVDEDKPRPLPNLDYKIMQGNSLLESYEGLDLCVRIEEETKLFRDENKFTREDIDRLKALVKKYFAADNSDVKKELQHSIDDIVNKFIAGQVQDKVRRNTEALNDVKLKLATANRQTPKTNADRKKKEDSVKKLNMILEKTVKESERLKGLEKELKQIQKNKVYPYFLWHLWFSDIFDNGGFDIVIGNPPYIQLQKDGGDLAKLYEKVNYQTFDRMGDIYSLFYERGWQLLKPNGSLCYITSNKWMRAGYGEGTRRFLADNTNPTLLVDFPEQKIFESATVVTNILLFSKRKNQGQTFACTITEKVLNNLSVFVRQHGVFSQFLDSGTWAILSPIERRIKEKIQQIGTPLKDWDIAINYGVKTGFNEAFIITAKTRSELVRQDPKSAEIIRPILRGRDIKRYEYRFADLWLINSHNGLKEQGVKPININSYPAIKNHLDQHYPELETRADKGDTPYNLRNCAYMDDFSKQKIVWGNLNLTASYTLAEAGMFINAPCTMIVPGNAYLLAVLNSKLGDYYIRSLGVIRNGGYFEYKPMFIEQLPVPSVDEKKQEKIENLVNRIVDLKKSGYNTEKLEREVDLIIFDIYNLSPDEIDFLLSDSGQIELADTIDLIG